MHGYTEKQLFELIRKTEELMDAGILKDPFISQAIQSFRLYNDPKHFAQLIRRKRFESWINSQHDTLSKAKEDNPFIPHPFGARASELDGPLRLGVINEQGDPFGLSPDSLTRNLQIYGEPGTGKSTAVYMLLRAALALPERKFNIIIIDPKRDYLSLIRDKPFAVVSSEDLRENPWEPPDGVRHESHLAAAVQAFCEANYFKDIGERFMESALRRCYEQMSTIRGELAYPSFSELLPAMMKGIAEMRADKLGGGQFADHAAKLVLRIEDFIKAGPALNCHKGLPWHFWQEEDVILTCSEDFTTSKLKTFVLSLWSKMLNHRRHKGERGDSLRTLFVCDEAYTIFNAHLDRENSASTRVVESLVLQGREFGIGWVIGAQAPHMVSQVMREQAAHTICFKTKAGSLDEAARILGLDKPQREHMNRLPERFGAVARTSKGEFPFQLYIKYPDIPDKDVGEEEIARANETALLPYLGQIEPFNRLAEAGYGGSREYQQDLMEKAKKQRKSQQTVANSHILLGLLRDNPYLYRSKLKEQSGLRHDLFNDAIAWLEKERMIERIKCITSRNGRKSEFFPLTQAAGGTIAPSHFKHTYYCDVVADKLKESHDGVVREYSDGKNQGRVDILATKGKEKIGYEITLSIKNVFDNIAKCDKMELNTVYILCEDNTKISQVSTKIKFQLSHFKINILLKTIYNCL